MLTSLSRHCILHAFNVDESGMPLDPKPLKLVKARGNSGIGSVEKSQVTACDGQHKPNDTFVCTAIHMYTC